MSANGKQDTLAVVLGLLTEKVFKSADSLLEHEEAQKPKLFSKSPPLHGQWLESCLLSRIIDTSRNKC